MSAKKELKNIVCNQFNAKNSKKSILSKLFKLQYQFELKIVKRIVKKIKGT